MAIVIYSPPQRLLLPVLRQKHLIHMPRVPRSKVLAAKRLRRGLPELSGPAPHRFIGQDEVTLRHQRRDIPIAQAKAKVEPDAMADDLCREPMTLL
jgi:hypothetical protein